MVPTSQKVLLMGQLTTYNKIVIGELERSVYLVSFIYPVHIQDGWSETPYTA